MIGVLPVDDFRMYGTREVIMAFYSDSRILHTLIDTLEQAIREQNAGLAVDLARTLVESVCKTILRDGGETDIAIDKLGMKDLFKRAMQELQFPGGDADTAAKVQKALDGMITGIGDVVSGISELRYLEGLASHGKHAYAVPPDVTHAQFSARCADALASFMIRVHKSSPEQPAQTEQRPELTENPEFNQWIDDNNDPVRIFELTYQPSEVLFRVDDEAYRAALLDYLGQASGPDEITAGEAEAR